MISNSTVSLFHVPGSTSRRFTTLPAKYHGPLHILTFALLFICTPLLTLAQERLCDTQFHDCREPLLNLIRNEKHGIDVAFWFMEDSRYVAELISARQRGVKVRVLVDLRANSSKRLNADMLAMLRDGGIPMRDKFGGDVLHHKMMLFHGQNTVEFSKANYTEYSFVPHDANNYFDEAVFFTNDDDLTNTFRRHFDDLWVDTSRFRNHANIAGTLIREYGMFPLHRSMNFPPYEDFANRAVTRYNAEMSAIDAVVYRVTDRRHSDAMVRAIARGVTVRLITEPMEYRNATRLWDAAEVDRMFRAGVKIKFRKHQGLMHQGSVVLRGLNEVIFGSSNWSEASAINQDEHNYFYDPSLGKPWFYQWFADQFDDKWSDATRYTDFQPLPPDTPTYSAPANATSGLSTSVTLTWDGGNWAHLYDIYFGTSPNPPLFKSNAELGSPVTGQRETFMVSNLVPGTTYYWRVVGKTWAQLGKSGPTWSFTTSGSAPSTPIPPSSTPGTGPTPYGGTAPTLPGTFQAENFDIGGQSVGHYDATSYNSGSVYRSTEVDIQATTDSGGGYNVGWTRAGEWLRYSVNVSTTGTYTFETRVANIGTGARFHVEVDGVDKTGPIAVPDTGGWQTWQTIAKTGLQMYSGMHVIRIVFENAASSGAAGNYNWFRLSASPSSPPLGDTPVALPVALPGVVEAENFDDGAQGTAYYDTSAGNNGGVYRATDVDIAAHGAGYHVAWARVDEWLKYTVNVTVTRSYTLHMRVANLGSGATFRLEVDGIDMTGPVRLPNTGGWDTWQTITVPLQAPLSEGQRGIRLVMLTRNGENSGVGNYDYFSLQ